MTITVTENDSLILSEETLRETGREIRDAFRALISENGVLPRPTVLSRTWKLDQTLCTRMCGALRNDDPLAALYQLPGPPSLKELTAAATRVRVEPARLQDATEKLRLYENLIRHVGGKKSNLDTLVGSSVIEAREKTEQRSKQSIFRGTTNLYGVQSEAAMTSYFVYPSPEDGFVNELALYGSVGMRRLRPELPILVGGRLLEHIPDGVRANAAELLHRETLHDDGFSTALKEFSTQPFPHVDVIRDGRRLLYVLPGDEGGTYEELTLLFASIERNAFPLRCDANHPAAYFGFVPRNPSKELMLDVFIHQSVWPGLSPRIEMTRNDTTLASTVAPIDRFDFCEVVESLGSEPARRGTRAVPKYEEVLGWVSQNQGWDLGDFRLFRLNVKYPVIGLRYILYFDLPK
ncbi:MAG: hypothetical protein KDC38_12195 [Planctomycetes bacterium]|nr:hypothetical protein [Planctomycetota bacterium]